MNIAQPGEDQAAGSLGGRGDTSGDVMIQRPTFDGTNSAPVVEDALQSNSRISDEGGLQKLPAPSPAPMGGKLPSSSTSSTDKKIGKVDGSSNSVDVSKTKSLTFSNDVDKLASKISKAVEQVKKKDSGKSKGEGDLDTKKTSKDSGETDGKNGETAGDDATKKRKRKRRLD